MPHESTERQEGVLRRALALTVLHLPQVESSLSDAVSGVGPARSCGITLQSSYGPVTVCSSDRLATELEELQYTAGDGPSLHAIRTGEQLVVADLEREQRWVAYSDHARLAGVRSSISCPLMVHEIAVGALTLYCLGEAVDAGSEAAALLLSYQVAGMIGLATSYLKGLATTDPEILRAFAEDSHEGIAIGIYMSRSGLDQQEARDRLRRDADSRGLSMDKFAQDVVQSYQRDS